MASLVVFARVEDVEDQVMTSNLASRGNTRFRFVRRCSQQPSNSRFSAIPLPDLPPRAKNRLFRSPFRAYSRRRQFQLFLLHVDIPPLRGSRTATFSLSALHKRPGRRIITHAKIQPAEGAGPTSTRTRRDPHARGRGAAYLLQGGHFGARERTGCTRPRLFMVVVTRLCAATGSTSLLDGETQEVPV